MQRAVKSSTPLINLRQKYRQIVRLALLAMLMLAVVPSAHTQLDLSFIAHLSKLELRKEHQAYLSHVTTTPDSISYCKAKFHLRYQEDSMFLETFQTCSALFLQDTMAYRYANNYFLRNQTGLREVWFSLVESYVKNNPTFSLITDENEFVYRASKRKHVADTAHLPENLHLDFIQQQKIKQKKPIVAAALSAVIPGLGALYIGNFQTFIAKISSHAVFGLQTAESILLLGIVQPLPLLNIGVMTVFYGANIVGSYRDTTKKKKDLTNQFLLHASEHYTTIYKYSLY
jgi:hypothetical protein